MFFRTSEMLGVLVPELGGVVIVMKECLAMRGV